MKQSLKTKLKQLWFPAVFRLPEPEFSKDQIDLLEELIQLIHPTLSKMETATRDERVHIAHFLVDLGTGIWRIRRKIEGLRRMPKEIRDALYSLESMWMSMSEGGVEIIDHIGTIPGKNEAKVVEVRDIPNLVREQVVDAMKPTILLRGEVIQLGEVIMGRPLKNDAATQHSEEPVVKVAAMEPREAEDTPPSETYLVETLMLKSQAEVTIEEAPAVSNILGTLNTPQNETPVGAWPETPTDDTAVSSELPESRHESIQEKEPVMIEETPQAAEPLLDAAREAVGGEIVVTAEPEPILEEKTEAIESELPAVIEPEGDIDVPDVPAAPKVQRRTQAAKTYSKAKIVEEGTTKVEDSNQENGENEIQTPQARKPARPKRKRPVKAKGSAETGVEVDG